MDHLLLTFEKLNVGSINDLVKDKSCGAISLFVGTTRDNFDDKEVLSLEYEAYEAMAIKQMEIICKELRAKWTELAHIAIYHRLGCVPVTEESIVIAISSPHRVASLEAVAHAIEQLKKRVPIWKKEQYKNEVSAWKENKECTWSTNSQIDFKWLKAKRPRFDAASLNKIETDDAVSNDLIQITAGADEIKRRIQCFIAQKRNEIDYNNIVDYTVQQTPIDVPDSTVSSEIEIPEVSTCARVNSLIVKQENSNCHLRVRTVKNRTGPQTKSGYTRTLDKLMHQNERVIKIEPGLEDTKTDTKQLRERGERVAQTERIRNLEEYLGLQLDDKKSIFQKLKTIEDRIMYLESISPEYKHFLTEKPLHANSYVTQVKFSTVEQLTNQCDNLSEIKDTSERQTFDIEDLDAIIERMEKEQEEFDRQPATTTSSNGSIYEGELN